MACARVSIILFIKQNKKMKKSFKNIIAILSAVVAVALITSCEKDEGKLPNIAFKTGAGYTSANATVSQGDTLLVGITASKAEDKDVLKKFNVTVAYDGGQDSTIYNLDLTTAQEDNYSYEHNYITRNQAGTELYKFTVINRDGLTNTVSLTLTVN